MRVDPATMTFCDISPEQGRQMLDWAEQVLLHGKLPQPEPVWVDQWVRDCKLDERQKMMLIHTALPARVLLSLLRASLPTCTAQADLLETEQKTTEAVLTRGSGAPEDPIRPPGTGWRLISSVSYEEPLGGGSMSRRVQWYWERFSIPLPPKSRGIPGDM